MTWLRLRDVLEELSAVSPNPRAALTSLLNYSFHGLHPEEHLSDEAFLGLPDHIEVLPIDLLGKYDPEAVRVTLYTQRIEQAAAALQLCPRHLRLVVHVHSWARAILHVGQSTRSAGEMTNESSRTQARSDADRLWRSIDLPLHEKTAQLLTWNCVVQVADSISAKYPDHARGVIAAFDTLSDVQPGPYRMGPWKALSRTRIRDVFDMLKRNEINPSGFIRVLHMAG